MKASDELIRYIKEKGITNFHVTLNPDPPTKISPEKYCEEILKDLKSVESNDRVKMTDVYL